MSKFLKEFREMEKARMMWLRIKANHSSDNDEIEVAYDKYRDLREAYESLTYEMDFPIGKRFTVKNEDGSDFEWIVASAQDVIDSFTEYTGLEYYAFDKVSKAENYVNKSNFHEYDKHDQIFVYSLIPSPS